jgi:hypothetical protein
MLPFVAGDPHEGERKMGFDHDRRPDLLAATFLALLGLVTPASSPARAADFIEVPTGLWETQGAGIALTNLDEDPRPEMILAAYDNPAGANSFVYWVGWNLDGNGKARRWDSAGRRVAGLGSEGQGAGIAVANLDGDSRPEVVFMAYENLSGENRFRYRVCRNMGPQGGFASCDSTIRNVPGVGAEGQGASVVVTNLDGDARPEMLLLAYDNPRYGNSFRMRTGWNLGKSGAASSWSSTAQQVPGVGWEGQGAGLTVANLDGNDRPELVLMAYDNPTGDNSFRYRAAWNVTSGGGFTFDTTPTQVPGVGWEGQGADLAFFDLNRNGNPDLVLMAVDNPPGANSFRYRVVKDVGAQARLFVEWDRLNTVDWVPSWASRWGTTWTLPFVYAYGGFEVREQQDAMLTDLLAGMPYTDAALDALHQNEMTLTPPAGQWHLHGLVLTMHVDGILGIIFDADPGERRRGIAVFDGAFGNDLEADHQRLRTAIHELGHALCLEHRHGSAWRSDGPEAGTGFTIMDQTRELASNWSYGWSAASLHHFYQKPRSQWRPDNGVDFGDCD